MRISTSFIILHEDGQMPNEESLMPSIWKEGGDVEGDYYYDNIDGRWTYLEISKDDSDAELNFKLYTYRENNRNYDFDYSNIYAPERFSKYKESGEYKSSLIISSIENLCVTYIEYEGIVVEDYQEFLNTVYSFLKHTNGVVINGLHLDYKLFHEKFIN